MKEKYIMALDQGTTSSRCMIFNRSGEIVSQSQREFTQIYPRPGYVEHDPMEIWGSQIGVAVEAMRRAPIDAEEISSIGITNQRETTVLWDKNTGLPVYNAIVWQCRRTADLCSRLKADGLEETVNKKTGLVLDPYFSGTKIKWILDHVDGVREKAKKGEILFGTIDTWLIWNLTAGKSHLTDFTNASRTMVYNIYEKKWDKELLNILSIPERMLPEVMPSKGILAYADQSIFGREIPISGVAGDQQAALFGQGCLSAGMAKNTYGTGCFLLMNTGDKPVQSKNGLITTLAASLEKDVQYALEGSVFTGGAVIQWLRDGLGLISKADETLKYALMAGDTGGVYIVPAFTGLGAPSWDPYARGIITGITRGTGKEHIIRAALESMAYQSMDIIHAMEEDSGIDLKILKADGGASANDFLMGFQADILNKPVIRPQNVETTALGAALLSGLGTGFMNQSHIEKISGESKEFKPDMKEEKRNVLIEGWQEAVKKALCR